MATTVRIATDADIATIADFNRAMALETENKELDRKTVVSGVRRFLVRPDYGFYLVAESEGAIAGCLMVTYEWSDWRDGLFYWIQSVYVHPGFRRQGVFKSLYRAVEERAKSTPDVCGLRLYVEQENTGAQATYKSLGMEETHYRLYESELN